MTITGLSFKVIAAHLMIGTSRCDIIQILKLIIYTLNYSEKFIGTSKYIIPSIKPPQERQ